MPAHSWSTRIGIVAAASLVGSSLLPAQRYWADRGDGTVLRADFLKPFLKDDGYQLLSGAFALSGSGRIGKSVRLEAEVPLARAGLSYGSLPSESSLRVGNPYLGVRMHEADHPWSGQLGVRLPLASDPSTSAGFGALGIGAIADPDQLEAFLPNVVTVRAGAEVRSVSAVGILIGATFGPSLMVATKGGGDPELFADYGLQGGYEGAAVRATIAVTGRLLATESGLSLAERTFHLIAGAVELRRGQVRPSVLIRIPLDSSAREVSGATVGFGLAIVL